MSGRLARLWMGDGGKNGLVVSLCGFLRYWLVRSLGPSRQGAPILAEEL